MKHKDLAKQAGFHISSSNHADIGWVWCSDGYPIDEELERFAELVRDDERGVCAKHYLVIVEQIRKDEREACAKLCESEGRRIDASWESCATAIRARWQK